MRLGYEKVGAVFFGLVASVGPVWAAEVGVGRQTPTILETERARQRAYFDPGSAGTDLGGLLPEGARSTWELRASLDGTHTDNVDREEEGREAFFSNGSAGLGWLRRSPALDGTFDYRFSAPVYQSRAVEDRDTQSHAAAVTARWQAARHLSLAGAGNLTQNVERGIEPSPAGLRARFENRFDEYGARGEYEWQPTGDFSTSGRYAFFYRNFLSGEAEGEDFRRHDAAETLGFRVTERDRFTLGLSYAQEETLGTFSGRENRGVTATWTRLLVSFLQALRPTATFSYAVDRGRFKDGGSYWNHAWRAGYSVVVSPRTEAGVEGGVQRIVPADGKAVTSWLGTARASHRITDHTSATLSAGQTWEYAPVSSRGEGTALTRLRRVAGEVTSRLARYWDGNLSASFVEGDPDETSASQIDADPYWEGEGVAALQVRMGRDDIIWADSRWVRRVTEGSDEDFTLLAGSISYRRQIAKWLVGVLRYSQERRDPDGRSTLVPYREQRTYGSLAVTW
ncbi:MAG: hypothetical protein HY900_36765 [Deltaproteobacteria bacterium]|nr:hypothetical protein [Deltaproteobacteria bacterium]